MYICMCIDKRRAGQVNLRSDIKKLFETPSRVRVYHRFISLGGLLRAFFFLDKSPSSLVVILLYTERGIMSRELFLFYANIVALQ